MKLSTTICGPDTSKSAAASYLEHRYDLPPSCSMACTTMDVSIWQTSMAKNYDETVFAEVAFRFPDKINIFQEVESYQFLDLVADLGGYLGLTLGLSLLDITGPVNNIIATTTGYFGGNKNWQFEPMKRQMTKISAPNASFEFLTPPPMYTLANFQR